MRARPTECQRPVVSGMLERGIAASSTLARATLGRAASSAVRMCPHAPPSRTLCSGCGILESVVVDGDGRLFFTSQTWAGYPRGALLRLDAPDAEPVHVSLDINSPGGLAFTADERLIVGYGNSPGGGLVGNLRGQAGLWLVDPETGDRELWVKGLGMANGVARSPNGFVFASNDLGTAIDRISPDGTVEPGWARVWSTNGLAIDHAGRYLYAAQSFTCAAIKRIEIDNPANVTTQAQAPGGAAWAVLDGLTIDDAGRLYVAANVAGQIWRVEPDGTICALARGLRHPSAVALGRGSTAFREGNLYAVTFCGDVIELENVI